MVLPGQTIDLWTLLFDINTQYAVIRAGMLDLRTGDAVPQRDWLGNLVPDGGGAGSAARRRKPVSNTLPDILARADAEAEPGPEAAAASGAVFGPIVDAAEQLLGATPGRHLSTWLVLFFLLASDHLKQMVLRGTDPRIAEAYFDGFDTRISTYICGKISYEPRSREARAKSGKILQSAVSPVEAVAREWHHLEEIVRRARQG